MKWTGVFYLEKGASVCASSVVFQESAIASPEFPERVQYALSIHSTLEFSGTGSDSVVIPVKRYTSLSEKVVDMIDACRHSCGVALATPAVGW